MTKFESLQLYFKKKGLKLIRIKHKYSDSYMYELRKGNKFLVNAKTLSPFETMKKHKFI